MPYTALSQTNTTATPVTNILHNQIAANDAYFKDSPEMNNVTVTGKVTAPTINTGSGDIANPLDQAVKTTDSVTHNIVTASGGVGTGDVVFKTKLFTGTTSGLGNAVATHGIDYNKILSVDCYTYVVSLDYWQKMGGGNGFQSQVNPTQALCGQGQFSAPFRMIVIYES